MSIGLTIGIICVSLVWSIFWIILVLKVMFAIVSMKKIFTWYSFEFRKTKQTFTKYYYWITTIEIKREDGRTRKK